MLKLYSSVNDTRDFFAEENFSFQILGNPQNNESSPDL